jgi:hypothetical protein
MTELEITTLMGQPLPINGGRNDESSFGLLLVGSVILIAVCACISYKLRN